MGEGKAFIGDPQVGVGIDVKNAEARVLVGDGGDGAQWNRVVASYNPHDLLAFKPGPGFVGHPAVQELAQMVDASQIHLQLRLAPRSAVLDDGSGEGLCFVAPRPHGFRDGQHGYPGFVRLSGVPVEKIDLTTRAEDGGWAFRGSGSIRHRRLPGNRDQDDSRIRR